MGFWPTQYTYTHSLTHIEYKARALSIPCNRKRNGKKKQNNRKKICMGRGNVQLPTFHSFTITYPYNIYLFYSSIPCTRTRIHSDGTHLTVGRREIYREMQCKCNNCFGASLNSNWECGLNIYPSISSYVCVVFFSLLFHSHQNFHPNGIDFLKMKQIIHVAVVILCLFFFFVSSACARGNCVTVCDDGVGDAK